ncbi:hypothetical protein GF580_04880 [Staphylococcus aureus]|nr:hypothetical protein [Staphylococcus aureus]
MQALQIVEQNETHYVDSREVAEMIGKRHDNLVRDIKGYIKVLEDSSKLSSHNFFEESTYVNSQNKVFYALDRELQYRANNNKL